MDGEKCSRSLESAFFLDGAATICVKVSIFSPSSRLSQYPLRTGSDLSLNSLPRGIQTAVTHFACIRRTSKELVIKVQNKAIGEVRPRSHDNCRLRSSRAIHGKSHGCTAHASIVAEFPRNETTAKEPRAVSIPSQEYAKESRFSF